LRARCGHWRQSAIAAGRRPARSRGLFARALHLAHSPILATLILFTAGRGVHWTGDGGVVPARQFAALARFTLGCRCLILALGSAAARPVPLGGAGLFVEALGQSRRAARLAGVRSLDSAVGLRTVRSAGALAGLIVTADIRPPIRQLRLSRARCDPGGGDRRHRALGGRVRLLGHCSAFFLQALTTTVLMHGLGYDLMLVIKASAVLALAALQSPGLRARAARWRRAEARA
jgi:ribose/xylose/arabinose/galactoside ABC-type transport system permease subunit